MTDGLRARAGRVIQRVYPNLDERAYFRARARDRRERRATGAYAALCGRSPARLSTSKPHVVVVPHEGSDFPSWAHGTRNLYFEAAAALEEDPGDHRVSVFHVPRGEPWASWHLRLLEYLIDTEATHLITHIESDPGSLGETWTWDSFWEAAAPLWGGVLLGVMFDSSYRFINAKSRLLARMSPRFMVVDICMPMDGAMRRGRPEVGPVNMPLSRRSLALVEERVAGISRDVDVSFIGVLYPYRVELIERIRATGLTVEVNPHRRDRAETEDASRAEQPSWLDYMAGLARSEATLNFSQSSAGPFQQLKTRVIEAGVAGTLLVTDDRARTSLFWEISDFAGFADTADLPMVLGKWFADPGRLADARTRFATRARWLAPRHFWTGIDDGLARRGLPRVGVEDRSGS